MHERRSDVISLMQATLSDHEKRIRWCERAITYAIGFCGAIAVIFEIVKFVKQ